MCLYHKNKCLSNIFLSIWILIITRIIAQEPVANLPQGRIVGIKVFTDNLKAPVEIYFGIPYAMAPVGRNRFSAPKQHPGWKRTFFAHRMPPKCPQIVINQSEYFSEDCLFLNIWTPRTARVDRVSLPVVVILYSESWGRGGITLPCQELAAEGVVVVTVSYRLHLLSFFTLRSIAARGNLALLDQYMALLWVRDNIAAFGGDPTLITLMGHSAGADSVLHHMSSPRSIGLFQRAIIMSPRNIWKAIDKEVQNNFTDTEIASLAYARHLGCAGKREEEILQCMQSRSLTDIMALPTKLNLSYVMQPIPDTFLPDNEQFLPAPLSLALSAKQTLSLDVLFGNTDIEAVNSNDFNYKEIINNGPSYALEYANRKIIPMILEILALGQPESLPLMQQAIHWEFWGRKTGAKSEEALHSAEALARMESSAIWGAGGALLAARLARRVTRLYVYRYSQPGVDLYGNLFNFTGAVHGSDLVSLLGDSLTLQVARRQTTPDEKRISSLFRKYVSNFIKFGSPTPENNWKIYKTGDAYVHDINKNRIDIDTADALYTNADTTFWLRYLPNIANLVYTTSRTETLTSDKDENRFRSGVFAMVGVSTGLLILLLVCAVLLHKERTHRAIIIENRHYN